MKYPRLLAVALTSFGLVACDAPATIGGEPQASGAATSSGAAPQGAAQQYPVRNLVREGEPLAKKTFGAPITETTDTALADIAATPASYVEKTVRTTGKVVAVCKKAGCWMEIGDDAKRAHIKMNGHSFFVPRHADGHTAIVQGTVKAGAPQNECGSKDQCGGEENGAVAKVEIVATGVEFVD